METPSRETEPYRVVPDCAAKACLDEMTAEMGAPTSLPTDRASMRAFLGRAYGASRSDIEMEAAGEAVVPLPDCKDSVQALLGQVRSVVHSNTTPLRFPDLSTPAAKERFKSVLLDAYQRMPQETEQLSMEEISELLRPVIAQIDLLVRAGNQVGQSTRTLQALIEDSWEQEPTVLDWMSYWVNPVCGCRIHAKLGRTTPPPHAPQCNA